MKNFIKKLFCKHNYKEIEGTRHMKDGGMDKVAEFKCTKCNKEIFTSIFNRKVNK